jgi:hypothetical protein
MKKICWWTGTDSLCLVKYPPGNKIWWIKLFFYRIKWKIYSRFFTAHWVVSRELIEYLVEFGIPREKIEVQVDKPNYPKPVRKLKHEGFNILYYMPVSPMNLGGMKFLKWTYGFDIYLNLKIYFGIEHKDIKFIWVNGDFDMSSIYPIIDLYIRPSRSDGEPRMIMECDINSIPYIWSRDGKPDLQTFINRIEYERKH